MVECPTAECREDLLKRIGCSYRENVSKKTLMWAVIVLLSTFSGVSTFVYSSYSRGQDEVHKNIKYNEAITRKLEKSVALTQQDIRHIMDELEKQGFRQEKILQTLYALRRRGDIGDGE